jgi:hypothetical protein
MIPCKMKDVAVWEALTGGPGLCVPWQLCFLLGNIVASACLDIHGHNISSYQVLFLSAN